MTPTAFVQPEPQAAARLQGRVVARQTLDAETRDAMFALLAAHFAGVDRATFDRDLDEKSCAILLEDDAGVLRGFSTMLVYESVAAGAPVSVIYSGDTIVERVLVGQPGAGPDLDCRRSERCSQPANRGKCTGCCSRQGFAPTVSCRCSSATSTRASTRRRRLETPQLLDVARPRTIRRVSTTPRRESFDSCGRKCSRRICIRARARKTGHEPMPDPHIAFFLERNPGFVRGDELVCLTRIDERNLTPAGRRMARPAQER